MPEMTWGQMREEAESQGFTPLPVGTYNAKVDKAEVVDGKKSSQIKARFTVLDGPMAGKSTYTRLAPFKNDGDVNGMFYQQVGALGFPKDSPVWGQMEQLDFEQGLQFLAQNIMEKPCIIDVDHQNYQGEARDNIKRIKPYGQGGPVPGGPVSPGAVPQAQPPQPQPAPSAPQAPAPQAPAAQQQPQPQAPAPAPAPAQPAQPQAQPQAPQQPAQAPQQPQAAPMAAPQQQQAPETPQADPAPQAAPQPGVPQIPTPPQPAQENEAPF